MATLVYSDVDGIDRSFALGADPVMVGRGAEGASRSDDPRVSRVHARFFVDQGALWVEDLGSSNGIFVAPHHDRIGAQRERALDAATTPEEQQAAVDAAKAARAKMKLTSKMSATLDGKI